MIKHRISKYNCYEGKKFSAIQILIRETQLHPGDGWGYTASENELKASESSFHSLRINRDSTNNKYNYFLY